MTYIEKAIKDAVKGGFDYETMRQPMHSGVANFERACLTPAFWQALGKARGWSTLSFWRYGESSEKTGESLGGIQYPQWQYNWHRFIDYLAANKDAESFFESL